MFLSDARSSVPDAWPTKSPKDVDVFLSKYETVEGCHLKLTTVLKHVTLDTTLGERGAVPMMHRPNQESILKSPEKPLNSARCVVSCSTRMRLRPLPAARLRSPLRDLLQHARESSETTGCTRLLATSMARRSKRRRPGRRKRKCDSRQVVPLVHAPQPCA